MQSSSAKSQTWSVADGGKGRGGVRATEVLVRVETERADDVDDAVVCVGSFAVALVVVDV